MQFRVVSRHLRSHLPASRPPKQDHATDGTYHILFAQHLRTKHTCYLSCRPPASPKRKKSYTSTKRVLENATQLSLSLSLSLRKNPHVPSSPLIAHVAATSSQSSVNSTTAFVCSELPTSHIHRNNTSNNNVSVNDLQHLP